MGEKVTLDMNRLWRLQACENEARALEEGLARMPQAVERARKEQDIREAALKAREAEGQDLAKKRRALEKEIEGLEEKVRANMTDQIKAKTNAQLDAYKKEALFLKEQKSVLETQVLEFFEREEAHQERVKAAREELERARAATAARQKEMDTRSAGEREALERRQEECRDLAQGLPPAVRSRFEQIARAKHGVAVVPVQRGACGGCFNALPPQFVNEVRKAEKLMICEGCGRIVVWPEGGEAAEA